MYTGATNNLRERFKAHNNGLVSSTKSRGPFELIYYEACLNSKDAFSREKYLKSGLGKRYIKNRLKRSLSQTGFSLIEVLLATGILSLILSLGLFLSLDFYKSYAFNYERNLLVSILQTARSRAMSNIDNSAACVADYLTCGNKPEGVYFDMANNRYLIFQRAVFNALDPQDQEIPLISHSISISPFEIVFTPLSGTSTPANPDIVLTLGARSGTIKINEQGGIIW